MPLRRLLLLAVTASVALATALAPAVAAEPVIGTAAAATAPEGPGRGWVVGGVGSGWSPAGSAPYGVHAPASTIKALLAMVVLDNLNPNAAARATSAHTQVECSCVGLVPGQVYTARQLLDGLLMVSGNDAANLLGDMLGGYRAAIARMTAKAASLGARHTRAMSPSGLDGPGWETLTTPHDLALIYRAALSYPIIAQIFRQPSAQFPDRNGHKTLTAQNKLLAQYPGDLAGKTGYTDLAGDTFVTVAQRDGRRLVVVLMKGDGPLWDQAVGLLDWGFARPR